MRRCPRLVELNNAVTELPLPVSHRLDDLELICNIGEQWGCGIRKEADKSGAWRTEKT
jgi:hypothetical protein